MPLHRHVLELHKGGRVLLLGRTALLSSPGMPFHPDSDIGLLRSFATGSENVAALRHYVMGEFGGTLGSLRTPAQVAAVAEAAIRKRRLKAVLVDLPHIQRIQITLTSIRQAQDAGALQAWARESDRPALLATGAPRPTGRPTPVAAPSAASSGAGRLTAAANQPAEAGTSNPTTSVTTWPLERRLDELIERTASKLPATAAAQLRALGSWETLEVMAAFTALAAAAQLAPATWGLDAIVAAIVWATVGWQGLLGVRDLVLALCATYTARTVADIDRAADTLADAVLALSVAAITVILHKFGETRGASGDEAAIKKAAIKSEPKFSQKPRNPTFRKPLPPEPEADIRRPIVRMPYDVGTEADEAFFWSGRTGGVGGEDIARQMASQSGGTTLEALIEKRGIKMPNWDPNDPGVVQAWKDISTDYAASASGTVRAVIGKSLRPGNVWETRELPALMRNPRVSKIVTIDPATGEAITIFERSVK